MVPDLAENTLRRFLFVTGIIQTCVVSASSHGIFPNISRIRRQSPCSEWQYKCNSGQCTDEVNYCNGKQDCDDGSDEANCKDFPCPSIFFKCDYGACISMSKVCDKVQDCLDNSDEAPGRCNQVLTNPVSGDCGSNQHKCHSGQCIPDVGLCNGKKDCNDGSDETLAACHNFPCPGFVKRCSYGACINQNAVCDGVVDCVDGSDERCGTETPTVVTPVTPPVINYVDKCTVPPHPNNGWYSLMDGGMLAPGDVMDQYTLIKVNCKNNFVPEKNNTSHLCYVGQWSPPAIETCVGMCMPLIIPANVPYKLKCTLNKTPVDCSRPVEGTRADVECDDYYTKKSKRYVVPLCHDGTWDEDVDECVPECGLKIVNAETLVITGSPAVRGEYPWVVAIYNESNEHICGGSMISLKYVLSAAHCFTELSRGEVLQGVSSFTIAAGIYYRKFKDKVDTDSQYSKIRQLYIPEDYKGSLKYYQSDIAVVALATPFRISFYVRPVCVDWDLMYDNLDLREGNSGVVAGWGYTKEHGVPAVQLKKLLLPYHRKETCEKSFEGDFVDQYFHSDKFCAGYDNQQMGVCNGDSGSGLYFKSNDRKYYIRGIVSLTIQSEAGGCNSNLYSLYTKVSTYLTYVFDKTRGL